MMPSEALLETKVDVIEQQLRCVPILVVPRDKRVAHDDFRLSHQPVRKRGVRHLRLVVDLHAGEMQLARGIQAVPMTRDYIFDGERREAAAPRDKIAWKSGRAAE